MRKTLILIVALAIIPCAVMAAEVLHNCEMAEITCQSGILLNDLTSLSVEEFFGILSFEEIQGLSDEELQALLKILEEKFGALSEEERAQLKEKIRQWIQEKMAGMTPEEREQMKKKRRQKEEKLAAMTPEERARLFLQMREEMNSSSLKDTTELQQQMQDRMADMTSEDLDRLVRIEQLRRQLRCCCPYSN